LKIRLLDEAERDLDAGSDFYESCDRGLGAYFVDCLLSDIESLKIFAGVDAKRFRFHRMVSKRFPYSIYHDVVGDRVDIYGVFGDRQRPEIIENALKRRG
jgi:plasmid stabilization system protein ParE